MKLGLNSETNQILSNITNKFEINKNYNTFKQKYKKTKSFDASPSNSKYENTRNYYSNYNLDKKSDLSSGNNKKQSFEIKKDINEFSMNSNKNQYNNFNNNKNNNEINAEAKIPFFDFFYDPNLKTKLRQKRSRNVSEFQINFNKKEFEKKEICENLYKKENSLIDMEIDEFKNKIIKLENIIKVKEGIINQKNKEIETNLKEIQYLKNYKITLENSIKEINLKSETSKSNLKNQFKNDNNLLQEKINLLQTDLKKSIEKNSKLEIENSNFQNKNNEQDILILKLQNENQNLYEEKNNLETTIMKFKSINNSIDEIELMQNKLINENNLLKSQKENELQYCIQNKIVLQISSLMVDYLLKIIDNKEISIEDFVEIKTSKNTLQKKKQKENSTNYSLNDLNKQIKLQNKFICDLNNKIETVFNQHSEKLATKFFQI